MNKAAFERALKATATGKALKEIKVANRDGVTYEIVGVIYDSEDDIIIIEVR
jgi:hypothetical protein